MMPRSKPLVAGQDALVPILRQVATEYLAPGATVRTCRQHNAYERRFRQKIGECRK